MAVSNIRSIQGQWPLSCKGGMHSLSPWAQNEQALSEAVTQTKVFLSRLFFPSWTMVLMPVLAVRNEGDGEQGQARPHYTEGKHPKKIGRCQGQGHNYNFKSNSRWWAICKGLGNNYIFSFLTASWHYQFLSYFNPLQSLFWNPMVYVLL